MRLPGVAPGHPPWRGDILAVKSQPRKLKGPRTSLHPRPMPFQQRTNTACQLALPTHGFTVVLSVFRGTPPAKPLNCKSVSNRLGARIRSAWAHHTGGTSFRSCASIRLALSDIIKTSLCYRSQTVHLSFAATRPVSGKQKTLPTFRKQGQRNSYSIFRTCLRHDYPNYLRAVAQWVRGIASG